MRVFQVYTNIVNRETEEINEETKNIRVKQNERVRELSKDRTTS